MCLPVLNTRWIEHRGVAEVTQGTGEKRVLDAVLQVSCRRRQPGETGEVRGRPGQDCKGKLRLESDHWLWVSMGCADMLDACPSTWISVCAAAMRV